MHVSQLSLSELLAIYVWEVDESRLYHKLRDYFPEALDRLFKVPEGLVLTADVSLQVRQVLDIMAGAGLIEGPPWKLTDVGHECCFNVFIWKMSANFFLSARALELMPPCSSLCSIWTTWDGNMKLSKTVFTRH